MLPTGSAFVLYTDWIQSATGQAMARFLAADESGQDRRTAYLDLVRAIYAAGPVPGPTQDAWQNQLIRGVLVAVNAFTQGAAAGQPAGVLLHAAQRDLRLLQQLFRLTGDACRARVGGAELPTWSGWVAPAAPGFVPPAYDQIAERLAVAPDWGELVTELAAYHERHGIGVVSQSWYLLWNGAALQVVADPDPIGLDQLVGLAEQKAAILSNTEPFVRGAAANNLLLYGPRGTGKSSLVRALARQFGGQGLRLVEVSRGQLGSLVALFRELKQHRQRFILLLDDLAFEADDAEYRSFKSTMEGALERRPDNVLLYATTNRRHMIPERWADRNTPEVAEVHGQDAMEEKLSLADRFGKSILFLRPNQEEYLAIVERLVAERGLPIEGDELRQAALRWGLWHNVPSGRSARQFVDDLAARLSIEG